MYERELEVAIAAARAAGDAIMAVFDTAAVRTKADGSPVTEADEAADRIIRAHLAAAFPEDAILTEEGADDPARLQTRRCWIVDPIDGTARFVARTADFDVYAALVEDSRPLVAVTLQPATGLLLSATAGGGTWIAHGDDPAAQLLYAQCGPAPRIGTRGWLGAPGNLPLLERAATALGLGASAFCSADGLGARSFIPPDHPVDAIVGLAVDGNELDAWEWDIAAVDLIVREAGGASTDLAGRPLRFNRPSPRMSDGFLLSSDPMLHQRLLTALSVP